MEALGGFFVMLGMFFLGADIKDAARGIASAIRSRR